MGDSEVDKCHPRTHVRGELNLGKEKLGGKRFGKGREGRDKWGKRKDGQMGEKMKRREEEGRGREDEQ